MAKVIKGSTIIRLINEIPNPKLNADEFGFYKLSAIEVLF